MLLFICCYLLSQFSMGGMIIIPILQIRKQRLRDSTKESGGWPQTLIIHARSRTGHGCHGPGPGSGAAWDPTFVCPGSSCPGSSPRPPTPAPCPASAIGREEQTTPGAGGSASLDKHGPEGKRPWFPQRKPPHPKLLYSLPPVLKL